MTNPKLNPDYCGSCGSPCWHTDPVSLMDGLGEVALSACLMCKTTELHFRSTTGTQDFRPLLDVVHPAYRSEIKALVDLLRGKTHDSAE